jgi:hypothetical protein
VEDVLRARLGCQEGKEIGNGGQEKRSIARIELRAIKRTLNIITEHVGLTRYPLFLFHFNRTRKGSSWTQEGRGQALAASYQGGFANPGLERSNPFIS